MGALVVHAALSCIIAAVCLVVWRLRGGRDWLMLLAAAYLANACVVAVLTLGHDLTIESVLAAGTLYPMLVLQGALPVLLGAAVLRLFGGRIRPGHVVVAWSVLVVLYVLSANAISPAAAIGISQVVTTLVFLALSMRLAFGPTLFYRLTAAVFFTRAVANLAGGYIGVVLQDPAGAAQLFAVATVINQLCGFSLLLIEYDDIKLRLDRASRVKTAFLANMSHELRTPLNAVIGFSELMQRQVQGPLPENYRRYAADIAGSGRQMLHLVDQLLEMAALDTGQRQLTPRRLDAADVVRQALADVEEAAAAQAVAIDRELPAAPLEADLDEGALVQLVRLLVGHAVHLSAPGAAVRVRMGAVAEGLTVTVADQGPGLSKERLQQLFAPFWQWEDALLRRENGAELGLVIARRLAELMQGSLAGASEPGQGTVLTLHLPRHAVA